MSYIQTDFKNSLLKDFANKNKSKLEFTTQEKSMWKGALQKIANKGKNIPWGFWIFLKPDH